MRIGYFLTHPIQYQSPMIRALVDGGVDLHVAYGCQASGGTHVDPGFGRTVTWDTPLLEGYPYTDLAVERGEQSLAGSVRRTGAQAAAWLREKKAEVVWIHGWGNPFPKVPWYSLATLGAARRAGLPVLLRGETNDLCVRGTGLRKLAHHLFLRMVFSQVDHFLAIGTANRDFYLRRGVKADCISVMPYSVNNRFFQESCARAKGERATLRESFGIPADAVVVLFTGRLVDVKGVDTLLEAFCGPDLREAHLLIVGEGDLRAELEADAARMAPGRVHFAGFRNQSELPAFYASCDLFVLPSRFEPWGLVVNEVMNAGKPVIVSDKVGSGLDLVKRGVNGDVFHAGDVDDLRAKLHPWLKDGELRSKGGLASLDIISRWGFAENLQGMREALAHLS